MTVTRDNDIDLEYQRAQARIARRNALKAEIANLYASAIETAQSGWNELTTPIKLDLIDWKYGTSLRAQYFSGRRTQQILATKRRYNLG